MAHKGDGQSVVTRRTTTRDLPNGKTIELSQLTLKDYTAIREKACDEYKRSFLKTWSENADLLPEDIRKTVLLEKFQEAQNITPDDLPMKDAWAAKRGADGEVIKSSEPRYFHQDAKTWVNPGDPVPELQKVSYEHWWSSSTPMGRMHTLWLSMRHCNGQQNMTLDEVLSIIADEGVANEMADTVGELSVQRLGNAEPPGPAAK